MCLGAFDNQDVSSEQLLAELNRRATSAEHLCFRSSLTSTRLLRSEGRGNLEIEGEIIAQPDIGSKFDLTLYVDEIDDCFPSAVGLQQQPLSGHHNG